MKIEFVNGEVVISFGIESVACIRELIGNAVQFDLVKAGTPGMDACAIYHALDTITKEHWVKSDEQKQFMIDELTRFVTEQNDHAREMLGKPPIAKIAVNGN